MRLFVSLLLLLLFLVPLFSCDDDFDLKDQTTHSLTRIHTDREYLRDAQGRYMHVHGINVSGSTKLPSSYDPVSYVGKPFSLEEADWNFAMLRDMGFNAIRLLITWEAVEPHERGEYDEEYLDYLEQIVKKAGEYGIYCLLDNHQDIFSRHLMKFFEDPGSPNQLFDEVERARAEPYGFNNKVQGDGAPQWVVQLALPEKDVQGPKWGLPLQFTDAPRETSDMIPFTWWAINMAASLDSNRCFAMLFAGKTAYPNYTMENGEHVMDYLQGAFADMWAEVAKRVGKYDNVLGYDLINESIGYFIMLSLNALIYQKVAEAPEQSLTDSAIEQIKTDYFAMLVDNGYKSSDAEFIRNVLDEQIVLPRTMADLQSNGFWPQQANTRPDPAAVIAMNFAFNRNHTQPFFAKVGQAIQDQDPDAVIFIEPAFGIGETGVSGTYATPILWPEGLNQIVYAPHFYTDIYPTIGMNQPPRTFAIDEKEHQDYSQGIEEAIMLSKFSLNNCPVVMGEFGTYWNFGGWEQAVADDHIISNLVLDRQYESYEDLILGNMLWCYSSENTPENGDLWNKEDFSVLGPDHKPRGAESWSRVVPRFTSGRPIEFSYNSPMHYYDPRPGVVDPYMEFNLAMEGKETDEPTEIFVPGLVFTDGFYVRISDGRCAYDDETHILYWWPENDEPDAVHTIRINPPYDDGNDLGWDYFFEGESAIEG